MYRLNDQNNLEDGIIIKVDSLNYYSKLNINALKEQLLIIYDNFSSSTNLCETYYTRRMIDSTKNFYRQGNLNFTRIDLSAGIIAGTFDYTIHQTGCDTLRITE